MSLCFHSMRSSFKDNSKKVVHWTWYSYGHELQRICDNETNKSKIIFRTCKKGNKTPPHLGIIIDIIIPLNIWSVANEPNACNDSILTLFTWYGHDQTTKNHSMDEYCIMYDEHMGDRFFPKGDFNELVCSVMVLI